ncbi:MAG: sensor histidine kinase [Lachnospiraceae bacterium]|nr:sensor histidine kinase [Lachnospiraceae bacterium]
MDRIKKEKSILGAINDLSHRLVLMLVFPIIISLVLMVFYAWKYHSAIQRIGKITELKAVVTDEIPEKAWYIISGKETFPQSNIYKLIMRVDETIETVTYQTEEENRISLIVAGRTMETLANYVDKIRDNINDEVPVVENEAVLVEVRDIAALVDSMLNEYIELEITSIAKMSMNLWLIVLVTAAFEILVLIIALLVRNRSMKSTAALVRKPIEKLEEVTAQIAEGTLDARIKETEVTELRNLTLQVNNMADRLEDMMTKSEQDAKKLRKAELRTLQAQINPHFLYNTLDAIVWKAEAGESEEVISLTSSLSDFFRISLSSGADWIPLSQEKKHIEGYLKIQQTRYRDILKYEIDIPEEIGQYYILKLLLQPLVENAIYHGIKIKRGGGLITVSAKEENGKLHFCVKDTGSGMTKERLDELNDRLKKGKSIVSEGGGGFGLLNVNMRIRLYYNEPEGLKIKSGPEGTEVSFSVPCRTKEEIFENESVFG